MFVIHKLIFVYHYNHNQNHLQPTVQCYMNMTCYIALIDLENKESKHIFSIFNQFFSYGQYLHCNIIDWHRNEMQHFELIFQYITL